MEEKGGGGGLVSFGVEGGGRRGEEFSLSDLSLWRGYEGGGGGWKKVWEKLSARERWVVGHEAK